MYKVQLMRNMRLLLAYEGTVYFGWQETKEGPSIEGTLRKALEALLRHPVQLQAASRTDVGVHASGQVVNFFTPNHQWELGRLFKALNGLLPRDLVVLDASEAEANFHPTLDVLLKEYRYFVCCGTTQLPNLRLFSWHVHDRLDLSAMRQAMELLVGEHDYAAFCNSRKQLHYRDTVRIVTRFELVPIEEGRLRFEIEGKNFLYKMVRNLVGTVIDVGRGRLVVEALTRILQKGVRSQAGVTAPAHGLFLHRIAYPMSR